MRSNVLLQHMNQPISVKPEPIKAQFNESYQAYYLSQLQRLKAASGDTSPDANNPVDNNLTLDAEQRNRVIARMEELAASIGARITIINQTSPL